MSVDPPPSTRSGAVVRAARRRRRPAALAAPIALAPIALALGALACALAASLARPRPVVGAVPTAPALRAVLVDGSGSVRRTRRGWARWVLGCLRSECDGAARLGEELLVVEYARDVRVVFGPGDPAAFRGRLDGRAGVLYEPGPAPVAPVAPVPQVALAAGGFVAGDGASHLARAVQVAAGPLLDPRRAPGRVLILSDGTATGTDPAPALAELVARGLGLAWVPPSPENRADLALEGLSLPDRVAAGAPLAARVDLAWLRPTSEGPGVRSTPALELELLGPGGPHRATLEVAPPPGAAPGADGRLRWTARVPLPPRRAGLHRLSARAVLVGGEGTPRGDAVGENDRASAAVRVGEALVVAALAPENLRPELQAALGEAPFEGVQLLWTPPAALAPLLERVDLVVSFDVGPGDLPPALHGFLEGGGGWLACAGWSFFGSWTRPEGVADPPPPEALLHWDLPLWPARELGEERDVILLVDGSGSMEGQPFERVRRALFQLVPAATPSDHLELRFFTESLGAVEYASSGGSRSERRAGLAPLLETRVPRGGTDIAYSLRALGETRGEGSRPGLVLLLTDGRSTPPGTGLSAVRAALVEARLDLRVLAVGPRPDRAFLGGLLLPGESLVEAGDLSDLTRLLSLEVNRRRVRRGGEYWALPGSIADPLARDLLAAQGAGLDPVRWGPLATYARAELAPGALPLWRSSHQGEPLLALTRVGLGAVACAAAHPGADWAPTLAGPALEPLLRALSTGARERLPAPRLEDRGDRLVLTGADPSWPALLVAHLRRPRPWGEGPDTGPDTGGDTGPGTGGEELATAVLVPGPGGTDLDPRSSRQGPRPGALGEVAAGTQLQVGLEGPAGPLGPPLVLVARGPAEWAGEAFPVERHPSPPSADPAPVPWARAPHPLAPGVLGLGVALLFLGGTAAILGGLGGQGSTGSDRR